MTTLSAASLLLFNGDVYLGLFVHTSVPCCDVITGCRAGAILCFLDSYLFL